MDNLREALHRALRTRFAVRDAIDDDSALFSSGRIDSLNVVELVSFVEEQIGQAVAPEAITLENFDTVNRILAFAGRLRSGA